MNERYQDNRQGKEAFTKDVIAKVVKQVGYDQAIYTANEVGRQKRKKRSKAKSKLIATSSKETFMGGRFTNRPS